MPMGAQVCIRSTEGSTSMAHVVKRINVRFDETNLVFDETFPPALEGYMTEPMYEAVIRKLNVELNLDIVETRAEMQKWAKIWACTSVLIVGLFLSPVLAYHARKYRAAMNMFLAEIKAHFKQENRKLRPTKARLQQWTEWTIKPSGRQKIGSDVYDSQYAFQVSVLVSASNTSKQYTPRQIKASGSEDVSADTSMTAADGSRDLASMFAASGTGKRVSFALSEVSSSGLSIPAAEGAAGAGAAAAVAAAAALATQEADEDLEPAALTSGRPLSGESLDLIPVADETPSNRMSVASSILPLGAPDDEDEPAARENRFSAISLLALGGPGDRSSITSLAPLELSGAHTGVLLDPVAEAENEESLEELDVAEAVPTDDETLSLPNEKRLTDSTIGDMEPQLFLAPPAPDDAASPLGPAPIEKRFTDSTIGDMEPQTLLAPESESSIEALTLSDVDPKHISDLVDPSDVKPTGDHAYLGGVNPAGDHAYLGDVNPAGDLALPDDEKPASDLALPDDEKPASDPVLPDDVKLASDLANQALPEDPRPHNNIGSFENLNNRDSLDSLDNLSDLTEAEDHPENLGGRVMEDSESGSII